MVPLSTLTVLARFAHLGCRFVLMCDFEGQELPIFDGWPTARIGDTDLIRQMSGSLQITLSQNRRCADDETHFQYYCSLYDRIEDRSCVDEARLQYEWKGERPDLAIVKSHWKRRRICAYFNEQDKGPESVFVKSVGYIKGASSQP